MSDQAKATVPEDLRTQCGLCAGTGKRITGRFASSGEVGAGRDRLVDCYLCKGRGWNVLPQEDLIERIALLESKLADAEQRERGLREALEADKDDFLDLNEYWNGGNGSAVDACQHTCEITEVALDRARAALAQERGEDGKR